MNDLAVFTQEEEKVSALEGVFSLAERLDFLDIQILRKFYMIEKKHPFDSQPQCFPILYQEMKTYHRIKIGAEGLRKRLDNLVRLGLLEKMKHSNPCNYSPVNGKEVFVRGAIMRFFLINGLSNFL